MAASPKSNSSQSNSLKSQIRQSRYVRAPRPAVLTTPRLNLLRRVADFRLISLPQLVRLHGPSEKSVQRGMRALFDMGLVDVVAVPRAALAGPGENNDAALLFGSAPNVYVPTKKGLHFLHEAGLLEEIQAPPRYGPQNALFLRHELALRDVRTWLLLEARRQQEQRLRRWRDGTEAMIDMETSAGPKTVRPDAWFVYQIDERLLVGFLEWDRGTERGAKRWEQKMAGYGALFASGQVSNVTGYENARVLIIAPTERRRDWLAEFVAERAAPELSRRFWLSTPDVLNRPLLGTSLWRQPGSELLKPLVVPIQ